MNSIVAWLEQLGLGQHVPAFEANAIDMVIASTLSDVDLRELGVAALGHRKRLLEAIDALPRRPVVGPRAERRYLTVLICDLVESTALSSSHDPEDLASVLGNYQRCAIAAIARFAGFVAQLRGDGVLAYFGYPHAQEDSAERAVRAALALVRDVGKLDVGHGLSLGVRVGIATGPVVVGDISGSGALDRNAVVGETPNLAARLEAASAPGGVVIAAATHRLVSDLFDCVELRPLALKGFSSPMKAWQVVSERAVANRFEAQLARGLTPHLGREAQLEALAAHWHSAQAGAGHLTLVTGEPGIGKSRLVHEFAEQIVADAKLLIKWTGSPHLQNSPLGPVIAHLERAAMFVSDDSPENNRAKLDALVAGLSPGPEGTAAVLASLLSLPAAAQDPPADRDAAQQKRKTLNVVTDLIESQARLRPVLLVCEDLHWFDPTTLDLLKILIERIAALPVLLIATFRCEFVPNWGEPVHATKVKLERLEPGLAARMVEQFAPEHIVIAPELVRRIVERADGIPLFIEELTKAVLESNPDGIEGTPNTSLPIPDSLQDSLVARLERLAPFKEIAQIGAAIGREFSQSLLEAVASIDGVALQAGLDRLVHSDLLQRQSHPSGAVYAFKHALVQDAAYGTLLHTRRRAIHRRIAHALESRFYTTVASQPERLAEHWERADASDQAIRYWSAAGQMAAARSAAVEAESHYRSALRLIARLPQDDARDRLELEIVVKHGGVLRATRGPPGLETGKAFSRARDLCRRTGDTAFLVPSLAGLFGYHFVRAENGPANAVARELLAFGVSTENRLFRMIGHRAVGMVQVHMGKPVEGREQLEQSLSLYDTARDGALAFAYGTDHAQTASSFLALAQWLLGKPDTATAREAWAVAHGSKVNHLYSLVQTAMFRIIVRALARDWNSVASLAQETLDLAVRHSFQLAITLSRFYLAASRSAHGANQGIVDEMRVAARAWGPVNYRPLYMGMIAEAQAAAGNPAQGLLMLTEARAIVSATGERWIEPELCRLSGELMAQLGPYSLDAAEAALREAIEMARQQSTKSWELRTAVSLARLLCRRGHAAEARAVLWPVHDGLTEGIDTPDMRDARSLLGAI